AAFSSWPASKQFPERGMPQVRLGYAKAFPFAAATPALWPGLAPLQRTPLISICVDGAPLGPNLPLTVCTSLAGAREFQIDVDLNHDGHFEASGERAYTSGSFLDRAFGPGPAIGKAGGACLRGLAPGNYQLRARVLLHGGGEMMGPVEELHVMPPPGHHLPVAFEPNQGQTDSSVLFLARAAGHMIFVTRSETVLLTPGPRPALPQGLTWPMPASA